MEYGVIALAAMVKHSLEIHLTGRRKVYKMMSKIGFSGKESEFREERGETGKVRLEPWRK